MRVKVVLFHLSSSIYLLSARKSSQVFPVYVCIYHLIIFTSFLVHPLGVVPKSIKAHCANLSQNFGNNFQSILSESDPINL